jgi:hypothetical protein
VLVSQPLKVHLDAMSRYADAMADLSADFAATRRFLVDADVTEDSFGMLPESRDAATVYEQRTTEGLDILRTGEDVFDGLGQAFKQMRDNYRDSDTGSGNRVRSAGQVGK